DAARGRRRADDDAPADADADPGGGGGGRRGPGGPPARRGRLGRGGAVQAPPRAADALPPAPRRRADGGGTAPADVAERAGPPRPLQPRVDRRGVQGLAVPHRDQQGQRPLAVQRAGAGRPRRPDAHGGARRARRGPPARGRRAAGPPPACPGTTAGEPARGIALAVLQQHEVRGDRRRPGLPAEHRARARPQGGPQTEEADGGM
ncbi:MAG: hypothetical protein AVDCRST_MAG64-1085, partial [uncultured Phycisphaerae bacterium]